MRRRGRPLDWICAACQRAVDYSGNDAHLAHVYHIEHEGGAGGCVVVQLPDLYGMTLWNPWLLAIAGLAAAVAKRIENRPWPPYPWVINRWIALHAGAHYDISAERTILRIAGVNVAAERSRLQRQAGEITTMVKIAGYMEPAIGPVYSLPDHRAWWFREEYGWEISEVFNLPQPIVIPRGWNKLWRVPVVQRRKILQQLPAAILGNLASPVGFQREASQLQL